MARERELWILHRDIWFLGGEACPVNYIVLNAALFRLAFSSIELSSIKKKLIGLILK